MDPTLIGSLIALLQSVPYAGPFLPYIPLVCVMAAITDAAFPPPPAGSIWVGPRTVIHILAFNFANSRNAVPAGAIPASVAAHVNEVRAVAAEVEIAAGTLAQVATGRSEAVPSPGVVVTGSKIIALALLASLGLTACAPTTPIPATYVQDARTALATYQAALGVAQVAVAANPALGVKLMALEAKSAPYVALGGQVVQMASTAPTLSSLAAELLLFGAQYVTVVPNGAAPVEVAQ